MISVQHFEELLFAPRDGIFTYTWLEFMVNVETNPYNYIYVEHMGMISVKQHQVTFSVWPADGGNVSSATAPLAFGQFELLEEK